MKESALSIANYFVEMARNEKKSITPLRLMKLVYLAHGYMLAMLDRSVINPRFDRVEAWKYGPVIPSVYHSFKGYGNRPVLNPTCIFGEERRENGKVRVLTVTPQLADKDAQLVCWTVWERFIGESDSRLVDLLHLPGSPWDSVYVEGMNNIIPDETTKSYYKDILAKEAALPLREFSDEEFHRYVQESSACANSVNSAWLDD